MAKSKKITVIARLTAENAHNVSTVVNLNHEEYGVFSFQYNSQKLNDGFCSTIDRSTVVFESEFHKYGVVSFK